MSRPHNKGADAAELFWCRRFERLAGKSKRHHRLFVGHRVPPRAWRRFPGAFPQLFRSDESHPQHPGDGQLGVAISIDGQAGPASSRSCESAL